MARSLDRLTSWLSIHWQRLSVSTCQDSATTLPLFVTQFHSDPNSSSLPGEEGKEESSPAGRLGVRAEAKPHSQPTAMHLDGGRGEELPHPAAFRGTVNTSRRGARAPEAALLSSQLNSLGKSSLGPQGLFSQVEKGTNGDHHFALTASQPANLDTLSKGFCLSKACLSASQSAPWTHWIQAPVLIV